MKLGPLSKFQKKKMMALKKFLSAISNAIINFPFTTDSQQSGSRIPDSW